MAIRSLNGSFSQRGQQKSDAAQHRHNERQQEQNSDAELGRGMGLICQDTNDDKGAKNNDD